MGPHEHFFPWLADRSANSVGLRAVAPLPCTMMGQTDFRHDDPFRIQPSSTRNPRKLGGIQTMSAADLVFRGVDRNDSEDSFGNGGADLAWADDQIYESESESKSVAGSIVKPKILKISENDLEWFSEAESDVEGGSSMGTTRRKSLLNSSKPTRKNSLVMKKVDPMVAKEKSTRGERSLLDNQEEKNMKKPKRASISGGMTFGTMPFSQSSHGAEERSVREARRSLHMPEAKSVREKRSISLDKDVDSGKITVKDLRQLSRPPVSASEPKRAVKTVRKSSKNSNDSDSDTECDEPVGRREVKSKGSLRRTKKAGHDSDSSSEIEEPVPRRRGNLPKRNVEKAAKPAESSSESDLEGTGKSETKIKVTTRNGQESKTVNGTSIAGEPSVLQEVKTKKPASSTRSVKKITKTASQDPESESEEKGGKDRPTKAKSAAGGGNKPVTSKEPNKGSDPSEPAKSSNKTAGLTRKITKAAPGNEESSSTASESDEQPAGQVKPASKPVGKKPATKRTKSGEASKVTSPDKKASVSRECDDPSSSSNTEPDEPVPGSKPSTSSSNARVAVKAKDDDATPPTLKTKATPKATAKKTPTPSKAKDDYSSSGSSDTEPDDPPMNQAKQVGTSKNNGKIPKDSKCDDNSTTEKKITTKAGKKTTTSSLSHNHSAEPKSAEVSSKLPSQETKEDKQKPREIDNSRRVLRKELDGSVHSAKSNESGGEKRRVASPLKRTDRKLKNIDMGGLRSPLGVTRTIPETHAMVAEIDPPKVNGTRPSTERSASAGTGDAKTIRELKRNSSLDKHLGKKKVKPGALDSSSLQEGGGSTTSSAKKKKKLLSSAASLPGDLALKKADVAPKKLDDSEWGHTLDDKLNARRKLRADGSITPSTKNPPPRKTRSETAAEPMALSPAVKKRTTSTGDVTKGRRKSLVG